MFWNHLGHMCVWPCIKNCASLHIEEIVKKKKIFTIFLGRILTEEYLEKGCFLVFHNWIKLDTILNIVQAMTHLFNMLDLIFCEN